jgi:hypothetical protein
MIFEGSLKDLLRLGSKVMTSGDFEFKKPLE